MSHAKQHGYPTQGRREPKENEYKGYLDYLRKERKYSPTTLWCRFSILTTQHRAKFGSSIKAKYPRLSLMLKNLSKSHRAKKAAAFTGTQLLQYMKQPCNNVEDRQNRCLTALAFYGGLRCAELRELQIQNIAEYTNNGRTGLRIKFTGVKRAAEEADRDFYVPDLDAEGNVFTTAIRLHLEKLKASNITEGPVARRPNKKLDLFTVTVRGRNSFYDLPKLIARSLGLDPGPFTGHSLRRSSARCAADAGCSVFDLQRHFGWKSSSMPQVYVDSSAHRAQTMANFLSAPSQSSHSQITGNTVVSQSTAVQRITIDLNINVTQPK